MISFGRGLIRKRTRRGWGIYLIWLVVYSAVAFFYAADAGGLPVPVVVLFLIPALFATMQLAYPTVLGWAGLFIYTAGYFALALGGTIYASFTEPSFQIGGGFAFFFVLAAGCVTLFWIRPRMHESAEPSAGGNAAPPRASA